MRAARISLLLEAANIFYDAPKLSQLAQLSDRYSSWIRHLTKDILTTKEAGGFETRPYILRVLSALYGQIFLTSRASWLNLPFRLPFFGCGSAALRSSILQMSPRWVKFLIAQTMSSS